MTFKCPSRSSVIKSGTNRKLLVVYSNFCRITHCQVIPTAKRCHLYGLCISLNSLHLICMHGRVLEIQEKLQLGQECESSPECHNVNNPSSSWNALSPLSSYVYRLIYMYVLTQVWYSRVIFHVWLKQTIRIFLPSKFTAECTNKRIIIILEVGIFQNQNCDLVSVIFRRLPAFRSVIFQVLQIQRPQKNFNLENLKFGLKFSVLPSITSGLLGVSPQNFFQSTCRKTRLINWVQFLEGPSPTICERQKNCPKFFAISDNVRLWSRISPERILISKIGKVVYQLKLLPRWKTVNFGPQTKKLLRVMYIEHNVLFSGDYISALRAAAPSNFYTRYRLTQAC